MQDLENIRDHDVTDHGHATAGASDESFSDKLADRLANGGAGHAEAVSEKLFLQPRARWQRPVEDHRA